ncbi:MAG: diacylglycerol/lipid kinase family protein [Enterococcus sp.]
MERILVVYNSSSGKDEGKEKAKRFATYSTTKHPELTVILQETGPGISYDTLVTAAEKNEIDTLVVIGGDGTLHHVVQAFEATIDHYTIGLLPGGTVNNVARVLEIPLDETKASEVILAGKTRGVDYGKANDTVILSTMTIGILADTAAKISQKEKQTYGARIFIKRFFQLVTKNKHYSLRIDTDNEVWKGKAQIITVTMSNSVGGYTRFDEHAAPDDGMLHLTILPQLKKVHLLRYIGKLLTGNIRDIPTIHYIATKKIKITSTKGTIGTRTDGDPSDDLPVELTVIPKGLNILIP